MKKKNTALESLYEAQKIAFSPLYFQAVMALRKQNVLTAIQSESKGIDINTLSEKTNISIYGLKVMLEAAECLNIVEVIDNKYFVTKVGYYFISDRMTEVNMNFVHDVCYNGAFYTAESIQNHQPEGLKVFGNWKTVYEGLSQLPEQVKKSWFEFDHFYSDDAFPAALEIVFKSNPQNIFDIGGNTGKWAIACCNYNKNVHLSILDLPGQLKVAKQNVDKEGFSDRVSFVEIDLLNKEQHISKGADVFWMSQFLDCFSSEQIIQILKNVEQAATPDAEIYILEPFIDNQRFEAAKFSLVGTSLYFTCMANGNSKMYSISDMEELISNTSLEVIETFPLIGNSYHTILKCRKRN